MLKALRVQVMRELTARTAVRRPSLRRSDDAQALLATDLPLVAATGETEVFRVRMEALGWRVRTAGNGWLLLDKEVPSPQDTPVEAEGDCACCLSLLRRHRDGGDPSEEIRAVVKAADAGRQPFARLCGQLHARLAGMLRRHEPLPDGLIPYLACAWAQLNMRRNEG